MFVCSETFGEERNSSREGDQPLVGVLYVEEAAAGLRIEFNTLLWSETATFLCNEHKVINAMCNMHIENRLLVLNVEKARLRIATL